MRRAAAGVVLLAALTACGTTPTQELVSLTEDVTREANAQDADGLRAAALALADEVSAQRAAGELEPGDASRLLELATTLRTQADAIDPAVQSRKAEQARAEAEAARAAAEQARRQARAEASARAAAEKAAAEDAARKAAEEAEQAEQAEDDSKGKGKGKGRDKDEDRGEGED